MIDLTGRIILLNLDDPQEKSFDLPIDTILRMLARAVKNGDIHYTHNTQAFSWKMPETKVWNHTNSFLACLFDMIDQNYPPEY